MVLALLAEVDDEGAAGPDSGASGADGGISREGIFVSGILSSIGILMELRLSSSSFSFGSYDNVSKICKHTTLVELFITTARA